MSPYSFGPGGNMVDEILGEVVLRLRNWRAEGVSVGSMVQRLVASGLDLD